MPLTAVMSEGWRTLRLLPSRLSSSLFAQVHRFRAASSGAEMKQCNKRANEFQSAVVKEDKNPSESQNVPFFVLYSAISEFAPK